MDFPTPNPFRELPTIRTLDDFAERLATSPDTITSESLAVLDGKNFKELEKLERIVREEPSHNHLLFFVDDRGMLLYYGVKWGKRTIFSKIAFVDNNQILPITELHSWARDREKSPLNHFSPAAQALLHPQEVTVPEKYFHQLRSRLMSVLSQSRGWLSLPFTSKPPPPMDEG